MALHHLFRAVDGLVGAKLRVVRKHVPRLCVGKGFHDSGNDEQEVPQDQSEKIYY